MSAQSALLIFAKNPVKGKVKTRLARAVGDEKALSIYKQLLRHTQQVTAPLSCDKFLYYGTQIPQHDEIWDSAIYKKRLQQGEGLGTRMYNAFHQVLSESYEKAVIIGTDCAALNTSHLQQAFQALADNDFVVGPAEDGGYYLLGMKQLYSRIFKNKAWSTDRVLQQTLQDFEALAGSYYELPVLSDIDTIQDWRNAQEDWANQE